MIDIVNPAVTGATPNGRHLGPPPYPGPVPFTEEDGSHGRKFYGRDREASRLTDLIISQRIVLFYSPSGAGKTSLIQASLLPRLRAEGSQPLPIARVGLPPSNGIEGNRYVLGVLRCLGATDEGLRQNVPTLEEFISSLEGDDPGSTLLVIDQFEEFLLLDPTDQGAKTEFMTQLGIVLRNRGRWAVIAMREDYLAGLDPYLHLIPTRLGTTFRLDLLNEKAAMAAIVGPAASAGVDLRPYAAQIVADLTRVRVMTADGKFDFRGGLYADPLHLQLVCLDMWHRLQAGEEDITTNLTKSVDKALASYYRDEVRTVAEAASPTTSERAIREWFQHQLITGPGLRNQVLFESERSGGLANSVIHQLEGAHLVRGETRREATWFELSHDRMVEPVRADNAAWFALRLAPMQHQARAWETALRPDRLLLNRKEFAAAKLWLGQHPRDMIPLEREFMDHSCRHLTQERREFVRNVVVFAFVGAVLVGFVTLVALFLQAERRQAQQTALLGTAFRIAMSADTQLAVNPELSILLASAALNNSDLVIDQTVSPIGDALRRALATSRLRRLQSAGVALTGGAFSPDGKFIVAAGADGAARLLPVEAGVPKVFASEAAQPAPLLLARMSQNGRWLATLQTAQNDAALDEPVRVWDVATGSLIYRLSEGGQVADVAFSPDSSLLATVSKDRATRLWNLANGTRQSSLVSRTPRALTSVAFAPNDAGRLITTSSDGWAVVWDDRSGEEQVSFTPGSQPMRDAEFSPDGLRVLTVGDDGMVARVWDVHTGQQLAVLAGHGGRVKSAHFSPDGWLMVTASEDGTARLWDGHTYDPIDVLQGTSPIVDVAFDPAGTQLVSVESDGTLRYWAATRSIVVGRGRPGDLIRQASFSPDGSTIVVGRSSGTAEIWDLITPSSQPLARIVGHTGAVFAAVYSPDGKKIATGGADRLVLVHDVTGTRAESLVLRGHTSAVTSLAFSPDGTRLVSGSSDATARIWDLASGEEVARLSGHTAPVVGVAYSQDGTLIATASRDQPAPDRTQMDQTARLWDAHTATQLGQPIVHPVGLTSVTFDPSGERLLTTGLNGLAYIWSTQTNQQLAQLNGHTVMTVAAFSPTKDSRWIATAGSEPIARVWDVETGAPLFSERMRIGRAFAVSFSEQGSMIAVAGEDGVQLVRCEVCAGVDRIRELARSRVTRELTDVERRQFGLL